MAILFRKLQHNAMLCIVSILILIYQDIAEARSILVTQFRMCLKQYIGVNQQVVKIHGITLPATLPVSPVNIAHSRYFSSLIIFIKFTTGSIGIRKHQMIFGITDTRLYHSRLIHFIVQLHFFDNGLDQTFRIGGIINSKICRKTNGSRFRTQNT